MNNRIGQGIDIHKLDSGTPLIIGGVLIPSDKGSIGHSDGDVLYHAIVDACLGAMALGDIGQYFPSSDKKWKNMNSKHFMAETCILINEKGYKISNIDSTIILQEPQIHSNIKKMKKNISEIFSMSINNVSIKATTSEKMGYLGREEGIMVQCITTVLKPFNNEKFKY